MAVGLVASRPASLRCGAVRGQAHRRAPSWAWLSERGVDALHGWTIPGREVNATSLPLGKSPFRDGQKPAWRLGVIVGTAVEDACHGP